MRKTNPISPHGTGIPSASLSGPALPVGPNHGRDAHATVLAAGIPHHSTILLFHHSDPMSIVQNEPNLACHRGPGGRRVQNEPNWPGPIAQNEPNLAWRRGRRRRNVQNEPNFALWDEGQMRKTNPISRLRISDCGLCKTNPISAVAAVESPQYSTIPAVQSDANCAKRTQFPPTKMSNHSTIPLFHSSNPGLRRAFCLPRRPAADIMLPESSLA